MDRIRIAVAVLMVSSLAGCGQNSVSEADSTASSNPAIPAAFAGDPAAQAALGFLEAVLDGDSQQASGWLTPMAMQQIVNSGKQFAPVGVDAAEVRVEQVFHASPEQAVVQCVLIETASEAGAKSENVHCLLRLVDDRWGVAAIAYEVAPDGRKITLNFESPPSTPRQPAQPPAQTTPRVDRYNVEPPTHTAQQPEAGAVYR